MNPQAPTSIWQKIALALFGLILSLVLLEVGLRLGGFVLLSVQEYENLKSIKQKGAYRILCLGESTTQGTYPKPLEQILNQRNIGVRFSVIDEGISGTNTPAILSRVESYLNKYQPDMVVAMMGINDGEEQISPEAVSPSKGTLFIQTFRTYKLAKLLWLHLHMKAEEIGLYKPTGDKQSSVESSLDEDPSKKYVGPNPKDDKAYFELGALYRDQGEFTQAEASFKKSIELNPANDDAYDELGWLYREQGKFLQAKNFLRKTIDLNPQNPHAFIGLARLYQDQGKLSQVEDFYKKAIEIDPGIDYVYLELGEFYRGQGKFSQDEDFCMRAIELNPKNIGAFFALVGLYRTQGKLFEAEDLLKKAVEFNPKNERLLNAMASLYEEMGKPELAKEYTKKLQDLRPKGYAAVVVNNYRRLKEILDKKGIKLICVQYPMRNVEPLKRIFEKEKGVIFVDNERVFKEALKKDGYKEYFVDMFGGDFGHCTQKGDELLAQNIADVILREVFRK